jgi:hypothetical protein
MKLIQILLVGTLSVKFVYDAFFMFILYQHFGISALSEYTIQRVSYNVIIVD